MYTTLEQLKLAYESGELSREFELSIDNDECVVWNETGKRIFEAGTESLLCQALVLLNIPWDYV